MVLPLTSEINEQVGPKIISRKPETPIQKEYQRYLEIGVSLYGLREKDLAEGLFMDQIITQAVKLLGAFQMDVAFLYSNPENILMTLAIAQELLTETDPSEKEKLYLAFAFSADNPYSTERFNYSPIIRDNYTYDYVRKEPVLQPSSAKLRHEEEGVRRFSIVESITGDAQQKFSGDEEINISDISLRAVLLPVCRKLGIGPERLKDIEICYLPASDNTLSKVGTLAMTEQLPNGKIRITLSSDCDAHVLEHEGYHIFLNDDFSSGYYGLLFSGVNEAGIEMLTQQPREYHGQRLVLEEIFNNGKDTDVLTKFFEGLRGNKNARIDFMVELIEEYGLAAYLQLALLDPGATHHIMHQVGKVNRIFRNPDYVREFFAHPKAA